MRYRQSEILRFKKCLTPITLMLQRNGGQALFMGLIAFLFSFSLSIYSHQIRSFNLIGARNLEKLDDLHFLHWLDLMKLFYRT